MTVINVAKKINVPAGATGTVSLYKVPGARKYKLKRVIFMFPVGTEFNVGLVIKKGPKEVCPDSGMVYGDGTVIELSDDTEFSPSESVDVYYTNSDAVNSYDVIIIVEGELT